MSSKVNEIIVAAGVSVSWLTKYCNTENFVVSSTNFNWLLKLLDYCWELQNLFLKNATEINGKINFW